MTTVQLYRTRAKEAREKAGAATDETTLELLREIANGFERLADLPENIPVAVESQNGK